MLAFLTGLNLLGLMLLLGGLAARRWLTPEQPALWAPGLGWLLLLLSWSGQIVNTLQVLGLGGADALPLLTSTATGRAILSGLLGATLLLAAEVGTFPLWTLLVPAALTLWGFAGVGHGAEHGLWVRSLHAAHAGAMTLWVGGVLALASARGLTSAHARRFTPVAASCVVVLTLTGILMAAQHLSTPAELLTSTYGLTLILKSALVTLTLVSALTVRQDFALEVSPRRSLLHETLLLLAVLGVTAVLINLPPPLEQGSDHMDHF